MLNWLKHRDLVRRMLVALVALAALPTLGCTVRYRHGERTRKANYHYGMHGFVLRQLQR